MIYSNNKKLALYRKSLSTNNIINNINSHSYSLHNRNCNSNLNHKDKSKTAASLKKDELAQNKKREVSDEFIVDDRNE